MGVGEETLEVLLKLGNGESSSGVGTVGKDTSGEGAGQASDRVSPRELVNGDV